VYRSICPKVTKFTPLITIFSQTDTISSNPPTSIEIIFEFILYQLFFSHGPLLMAVGKGSWKEREVGKSKMELERLKLENSSRSWKVPRDTLRLIMNLLKAVT